MPAKKPDSETVEVVTSLETTATDPSAESTAETTTATPETTRTGETTETTPLESELIDCVTLHGRLTHEGKTYAPHEKVSLPAELARGLIAAGHVAKVE